MYDKVLSLCAYFAMIYLLIYIELTLFTFFCQPAFGRKRELFSYRIYKRFLV